MDEYNNWFESSMSILILLTAIFSYIECMRTCHRHLLWRWLLDFRQSRDLDLPTSRSLATTLISRELLVTWSQLSSSRSFRSTLNCRPPPGHVTRPYPSQGHWPRPWSGELLVTWLGLVHLKVIWFEWTMSIKILLTTVFSSMVYTVVGELKELLISVYEFVD